MFKRYKKIIFSGLIKKSKISYFFIILKHTIGAILVFLIQFFYRIAVRPWLSGGCRFHPTCSAYAIEAVQTHGTVSGIYLMLKRIVRCHPWGPCECDPVPIPLFSSRS